MTGTPRTGTEQLLLTGTWDAALFGVDFKPLAGSRVYLDDKHISVVDKDWIISSIRRTMAEQGVLLEDKQDKAQVILEAAFGAYGTDERQRKFGLPGLGVSPSLTTGLSVSTSNSAGLTSFGDQPARRGGQGHRCSPTIPKPGTWCGSRARCSMPKGCATTSWSARAPTG